MAFRILLTVPNLVSNASPWREAIGLAKYLPRDRFRLTICALRRDGLEESRPLLNEMGVQCFVSRFRSRGWGVRRFVGALKDSRSLREFGPFDLQHSMDFTSSPFEALMSRRQAGVYLFSQRNMNRNGSRLMLKAKASLAGAVFCVSDAVLQFMRELSPSARLIRIHPGIDTDLIPWRESASSVRRPFRILMVGHVARLKRFEDGIRAVACLRADLPGLELRIAGAVVDPAYLQDLKQLVRREQLDGLVSFLGPRRDVLDLMGQSDVLLHTADTEAFGMVLIEAMAVSLPVIAPAIEGPKEIVEDQVSGLLVPPGEVGRYAEAIRALMKNPELGHQLSFNARKRVETLFNAERMAQETAEVYTSLLTMNHGPRTTDYGLRDC